MGGNVAYPRPKQSAMAFGNRPPSLPGEVLAVVQERGEPPSCSSSSSSSGARGGAFLRSLPSRTPRTTPGTIHEGDTEHAISTADRTL